MPRRKELKGIAIDFGQSVNSRNNDHLGYWATGQICLIAANVGANRVTLDILKSSAVPNSSTLIEVCGSMRRKLIQLLRSHRLPLEWLESATLEICFDQEHEERNRHKGTSIGFLYSFKLTLVSDLGSTYEAKGGGSCLPHNAERELRRSDY